jgi:hypothetical protein
VHEIEEAGDWAWVRTSSAGRTRVLAAGTEGDEGNNELFVFRPPERRLAHSSLPVRNRSGARLIARRAPRSPRHEDFETPVYARHDDALGV